MDNGMTREEYEWFMQHGSDIKPYCVMGNDYYNTNEHTVPPGNEPLEPSGEIFGYYIITRQYFERYHLPVMHTETNIADAQRAPAWLWKEWSQMVRLKQDGVPIIGFTWYSLVDQVDWDTALREDNGNVNPLGLYDLDRKIRPVGEMYRTLVEQWRDILPLESLGVDLGLLQEERDGWAVPARDRMAGRSSATRPPSGPQRQESIHPGPARKEKPENVQPGQR
jgi:hypothetical protein